MILAASTFGPNRQAPGLVGILQLHVSRVYFACAAAVNCAVPFVYN